jgi:thymidine kinase
MSKLYFRYGTVKCGKSLDLIKVIYNYKEDNKDVILIKPSIDTKNFGIINSRACDTSYNCDYILYPLQTPIPKNTDVKLINNLEYFLNDITNNINTQKYSCVLVDECQFLEPQYIYVLYTISKIIPVICYGLKTNYKQQLFNGSARLLELADSIEEIKSICYKCNKKAIFSVKTINDKHIYTGVEIEISHNEIYKPVCKLHY